MKDPKRLLSHGATDFERQLLRSAMNERPSALLRSRMQRGLGLVGPLAWASNVKAMLSTFTTQASAGVAIGGLAIGGLVAAGASAAVSFAPRWSAEAAHAQISEPQSIEAAPQRPAALPPVLEAAALTPALPVPVTPDVETLPAPAAGSQLRDEIALLDAARAAIQRGNRKRALQALNEYRERFPTGILERESRLLRRQATQPAPRRRPRSAGRDPR